MMCPSVCVCVCTQDKDRIDIGWASVWVKTSAMWMTSALYVWMLIAPALFPDREFA